MSGNYSEAKHAEPKRERLEVGNMPITLLEPTLGKKPVMKLDALPQSSVLDRLKTFLPEMAAANDKLQEDMSGKAPREFDIEDVGEGAENYIEMDLACGVVDLKDSSAVVAAERAIAAGGGSEQPALDGGSSSSDSDSDSEAPEERAKEGHSQRSNEQQGMTAGSEGDASPSVEDRDAGKGGKGKGKPKIVEMP